MTWTPDMPDRRSASDMVSWKAYVDRVFEEHRLQVAGALLAHDQRVAANAATASDRVQALGDHLTAMNVEGQRATEIAEREREKAAQALAQTLGLSIHEGDERLREHIQNQVEQINAALVAVEGRALLRHDSINSEFILRQKASDAAVQKAEDAQKDVNERGNEFRGQLKDQNNTMMPRLEAEALLKELRASVDKLDDKLVLTNTRIEKAEANKQGAVEVRGQQQIGVGQMTGIIGLVIALAAIAVGVFH